MRALLALVVLAVAPLPAAQVETPSVSYATPFLPLSSEALAVAEAGAFGPTSDPLRMLDNPALLADFAGGVSVSGDLIPDWLGFDAISVRGLAVAGGKRVTVGGLPVALAAGLAYGAFDSSPGLITDDQGNSLGVFDPGADQTLAVGIGAAVGGPVRVRVGTSVRGYASEAFPTPEGGEGRVRSLAADVGLDVTAPVGRWIMPTPADGFQLVADVTAGYALRGIGISESSLDVEFAGFVSTVSGRPDQTPSAGVTVLLGLDAGVGTPHAMRGASLEFLTTADDASGADFWGLSATNVLLGAGGEFDRAVVRRGYRLTLAETLTLSMGRLRGASFVERESAGATLSLGGALRLAGALGAGEEVSEVGRRVDLRYTYAAYTFRDDRSPFGRTASHGLTLRATL